MPPIETVSIDALAAVSAYRDAHSDYLAAEHRVASADQLLSDALDSRTATMNARRNALDALVKALQEGA